MASVLELLASSPWRLSFSAGGHDVVVVVVVIFALVVVVVVAVALFIS